jgi:hypothetical protein
MPNKVREFPAPANPKAVPIDEPIILFSLGGRRFAVRWIVTELNRRSAEVIPIQKQRQGKRPRSTHT